MRRILLFFSLFLLGFLPACGGGSRPPQTLTSTFAFIQEVPNNSYVFTPTLGKFLVTGSNIQFQTEPAALDAGTGSAVSGMFYSIVLSSNEQKAAFDLYGGLDSVPSNQWDVWVVNADGTNLTQLTNDAYDDALPQFSENGSKVVFASYRPVPGSSSTSQWQIVTMNANGTGEAVLPIPSGVLDQYHPVFSPDGSKIAMSTYGCSALPCDVNSIDFAGVMVVNSDGSNPVLVTNPLYSQACYYCLDEMPMFTADGSKIVFSRYDFNYTPEIEDIYTVNVDGTGATRLTDGVGINADPSTLSVQAVGEKILFSSNRATPNDFSSGNFDLYSMNLDGTQLQRLTSNALYDGLSGEWYDAITTQGAAARHTVRQHGQLRYRGHSPATRPNWR